MSDGIRCKCCDKPIFKGEMCSMCKEDYYGSENYRYDGLMSQDEIIDIIADNKCR